MRPADRGMTLIELALALAVLAIVATLGVPSLQAYVQRHRLKATAQELAVDLAEARFEAARRGQPLHLVPVAGADWCWAVATAAACDCHLAASCTLKTVHARTQGGVQLASAQAVALSPTATMAGGSATSTLVATLVNRNGERLRVELSALGRPRLCAPDGALGSIAAC